MKKVGIYLRVSTEQQVEKDSLPTQEKLLRSYCAAKDYKIVKVYREEGESAKDLNRTKLEHLRADVEAGLLDIVLVVRLDRITRSNRDLWKLVEFFEENNTKFISITENIDTEGPTGRFMLNIIASLAQMERETTARRVSEAMYNRTEEGKWNGGIIPYGYTTQTRLAEEYEKKGTSKEKAIAKASETAPQPKILYVDETEAKIIAEIYDHYLKSKSLRNTVQWLNANGHRTRKGKLWASSTIHRLLSNPFYVGQVIYGKRTTDINSGKLKKNKPVRVKKAPGNHPPIIPITMFNEAQQILRDSSLKPTRKPTTYLLSGGGLLRCGKCGGSMYGYTFINKGDTTRRRSDKYFYYKCHNHTTIGNAACEGLSLPGEALEGFVIQTLMDLCKNHEFLTDKKKMLQALEKEVKEKQKNKGSNISRLKKEESNLQNRIETLLEKLETKIIDDETFTKRHGSLKELLEANQLAQIEATQNTTSSESQIIALQASFNRIASFKENWNTLDDKGKAALLKVIVKRITATREKIEMDIYLDLVDNLSHKDMDSLPLRA